MPEPTRATKIRVVHFCTVHQWNDVRVFHKICVSLVKLGYEVHGVFPKVPADFHAGVFLHASGPSDNRALRMSFGAWRAFRTAFNLRGDIYHIHDPELLPYAFLLRLLGKQVVYDVHEDFVTLIAQKSYVPPLLRGLVGKTVRLLERLACLSMVSILAERYYATFLPRHTEQILNYPVEAVYSVPPRRDALECRGLLYTGNVSVDRGAIVHARILRSDSEVVVHLIGNCLPVTADLAKAAAGDGVSRLHIPAIGTYLPHEQLRSFYARDDLLAALAIFPSNADVVNKELTKMFEYMAAGLPILCSNFPVWKKLVEDSGVGLAVDPDSPDSTKTAINWLIEHPTARQEMSERGRELVRTQFNWKSQEIKLAAVYSRISQQIVDIDATRLT